jgi:diacylglycerol kinase family enzyme
MENKDRRRGYFRSHILWEALNTRSVGPALSLAGRASTKDGRLDLVCVGERDRSALMKYLEGRLAGQRTKLSLPIRRFRKLKVSSKTSTIHIDDRFWPRKKQQSKHRNEIEITVKPSALIVRQPALNLNGCKPSLATSSVASPSREGGALRDPSYDKRSSFCRLSRA